MAKNRALNLFEQIVNWYKITFKPEDFGLDPSTHVGSLLPTLGEEYLLKIEDLIQRPLPEDIKNLYAYYGDQSNDGYGVFLGHYFLNTKEIYDYIKAEFDKVKPVHRFIENPSQSQTIIDEIIDVFMKGITGENWKKIEFHISESSFGHPNITLENGQQASLDNYKIDSDKVFNLSKKIYDLEKQSWNWDEIKFTIYPNSVEVKRVDWQLYELNKSIPPNTIKQYSKLWIPILSDNSGNYIGIDFDPDILGKFGQIIFFGADEYELYLLANSWEEFLEWNLDLIEYNPVAVMKQTHLHDFYKAIIDDRMNI